MYNEHFGLAQYPFSLTPNTRFFLKLPSHQEAFGQLVNSLGVDGAFAKLTGEVGTGKTMLCRKVLHALDNHRDKFITAYIPHPILSEEGTLLAIAQELEVEAEDDSSYYELLKLVSAQISAQANSGRRIVLFIDEAQAMPEESLKAIFLLTQVEVPADRKMQVVLFGQPELNALLQQPGLTQLQEHVNFSYVLPSLDRAGTEAYVQHRLAKAGYSGPHMFSADALDRVHDSSGGNPRLINILCHKALMVAFGKGERTIRGDHIQAAVDDTESARPESGWRGRLFLGKR
jgi:MSHA biogenesis protein MshM